MPKMKTHRGTRKRIRITGSGKARRHRAGKSHLLVHKSGARRRRLRRSALLSPSDQKRIRRLLPYA
ncbi:MAG: 50S ribosomal protein L35 [Firmicutes bacterium]|nr:50S ribosomal protein L35 [Alicyclobacillaceae bacterium]MCL6498310.1 50S ribosomal protein L35 [Bacillota bacterium]